MKYLLYVIYDKVAEQYGLPFASLNDATATRQFQHQVGLNQLAEPTDFELFQCAVFNTDNGQLTDCSLRFICKGKVMSNG